MSGRHEDAVKCLGRTIPAAVLTCVRANWPLCGRRGQSTAACGIRKHAIGGFLRCFAGHLHVGPPDLDPEGAATPRAALVDDQFGMQLLLR